MRRVWFPHPEEDSHEPIPIDDHDVIPLLDLDRVGSGDRHLGVVLQGYLSWVVTHAKTDMVARGFSLS